MRTEFRATAPRKDPARQHTLSPQEWGRVTWRWRQKTSLELTAQPVCRNCSQMYLIFPAYTVSSGSEDNRFHSWITTASDNPFTCSKLVFIHPSEAVLISVELGENTTSYFSVTFITTRLPTISLSRKSL